MFFAEGFSYFLVNQNFKIIIHDIIISEIFHIFWKKDVVHNCSFFKFFLFKFSKKNQFYLFLILAWKKDRCRTSSTRIDHYRNDLGRPHRDSTNNVPSVSCNKYLMSSRAGHATFFNNATTCQDFCDLQKINRPLCQNGVSTLLQK